MKTNDDQNQQQSGSVEICISLPDVSYTQMLGAQLAKYASRGDIIFLNGDLGAGKTAFSRGYVRAYFNNPHLDVPSPTYLLHFVYNQEAVSEGNTYVENKFEDIPEDIRLSKSKSLPLKKVDFKAGRFAQIPNCCVNHLDPYRLPEGKIASLVDFDKMFRNEITLIEWPERLGFIVPEKNHLTLELVGGLDDRRIATLRAPGNSRWAQIIRTFKKEWAVSQSDIDSESLYSVPFLRHSNLNESDKTNDSENYLKNQENLNRKINRFKIIDGVKRPLIVLGIESSCDDTGAAVVSADGKILGECLASQNHVHEQYGGVKPDAARSAHQNAIDK